MRGTINAYQECLKPVFSYFDKLNITKKSSNLLVHTNIQTTQIYLDINNKNNQIKNEYYNPLKDPLTA